MLKNEVAMDERKELVQVIVTALVVVGIFFGCWISAFNDWGWLLGLAFGWVPAALLAGVAGWITYHLWQYVLGLFALLVLLIISSSW